MSKYAAENDAAGCHPRWSGSNASPVDPIGTFCEHGHHFQDPEPCEGCWPEATAELCSHGMPRTSCTDKHAETEPSEGETDGE